MIKGVNKRIIEINNPQSIYFEKAIFYLKPNVRELPAAVTEREIERFVSQIGLEYYAPKKTRKAFRFFFAALTLIAISTVVIAFIH